MPSLEIKGLDTVLKKVDPKRFKEVAKQSLSAYALKVDMEAKKKAPVDLGQLRSSIYPETAELDNLKVSFVAGVDYAAYIEFGTGPFAAKYVPSLEPEWQSIAKEYYVNGEGRVPAQPFLHPAIMNNIDTFNKKFDELI